MIWLGLFAVFFFGFCFGIFIAGLMIAARDDR